VDEIIKALIARADGMYLWIILQMNHLCDQKTDHDIRAALNDLPRGLEKTFIRFLKKIDALAPPSRERVKRVLLWVVCAERPLRLAELTDAVAIDEMVDFWDPKRVVNKGQSLVDDCAHLLDTYESGTTSDRRVQLVHSSVNDFLTSNPALFGATLPLYHIYPIDQARVDIANMCFRYFTTICNGPQSFTLRSHFFRYWITQL